ncbi:beta-1,4-N-acetylgalactosaminyltransferase bre-4-like [Anabrus simplex]|uniref:beta-1,4-N-acetylgalactosaminyltransferase bre-4-like n=1 Tax=Anabrus simplex TaxID=316456 RepID=UPI0035A3A010
MKTFCRKEWTSNLSFTLLIVAKMCVKLRIMLFSSCNIFKILLTLILLRFLLHCLNPGRFSSSYPFINEDDILNELEPSPFAVVLAEKTNKPLCVLKLNNLSNSLQYPSKSVSDSDVTDLSSKLDIKAGGSWEPSQCVSQYHIAVVVPFRNRSSQLQIFLSYMHPFLQNQLLSYRIFVVEQSMKKPFNRAKLFNIGYVEALKILPFHCFIFHDVDLIPQRLRNVYACTHHPRHMSSSLNTFRYNLPYQGLFGGGVAILQKHFDLVNGFSNIFFGWGGEDDDFYNRVRNRGLQICRFPPHIARYIMLSHTKESPNKSRFINLYSGMDRFDTDGLNNLKYNLRSISYQPLYTWILVDI